MQDSTVYTLLLMLLYGTEWTVVSFISCPIPHAQIIANITHQVLYFHTDADYLYLKGCPVLFLAVRTRAVLLDQHTINTNTQILEVNGFEAAELSHQLNIVPVIPPHRQGSMP